MGFESVVCKVDSEGRVTIPEEVRNIHGIEKGSDYVYLSVVKVPDGYLDD